MRHAGYRPRPTQFCADLWLLPSSSAYTRACHFVWTPPCNFNAGRFVLTYAKKSCRGCKIVAVLDGDELPTSRPVRFTLGEVPGAYLVPKLVWTFWRKAPCSCRDSNPDRPARRMVTVIENVALFPRVFFFAIYLHFGLKVSVNDNARVQETAVLPADQVPPGRRVSLCQKTNRPHPRPILKLLGATCWCGRYVLVASIQHISQCTYCVCLSVS